MNTGTAYSHKWQSKCGRRELSTRLGRGEVSQVQLRREILEADRRREERMAGKLTITRISKGGRS